MAFSPIDPATAHSLWLQLRHTKSKRRPHWRSDWSLLWVALLLVSVLLVFYAIMPSNDVDKQAEQAAQNQTVLKTHPLQSASDPEGNHMIPIGGGR